MGGFTANRNLLTGQRASMIKVALLDDYQNVALRMADWSILGAQVQVIAFTDNVTEIGRLSERLADCEIVCVMRERTPFPRALMQAAAECGVTICCTSGARPSIVELTWALILALVRHIPQEHAAMHNGLWQTTLGTELFGKTLGLLGLGTIGTAVARIGIAFGMNIIAWSQNLTENRAKDFGAEYVTKDELFRRADILSIHLVLSDRTKSLVGAKELSQMGPHAYLVNTSRGPIVDESALITTLLSRRIAGAALDVFDQEPLPKAHVFRTLENVITTPHIGYVTEENYRVFYQEVLEDIAAFLRGAPVRVIAPQP